MFDCLISYIYDHKMISGIIIHLFYVTCIQSIYNQSKQKQTCKLACLLDQFQILFYL